MNKWVSLLNIGMIKFRIEALVASFIKWSAFITTNQKVAGSISDTSMILKVDYIWIGVHPALRGQLDSYLIEK